MKIDIQHVHASDLVDFAAVVDAGFRVIPVNKQEPSYTARGLKPSTPAIVALHQGKKIIGALYWMRYKGMAFVCIVFVLPRYRKHGVYRSMLEALKKRSIQLKLTHIMAVVDDLNKVSIAAHRGLGFEEPVHVLKISLK